MKWSLKVIIAGVIVVTCMVLAALKIDTFVQQMGMLAAGYLFGTQK